MLVADPAAALAETRRVLRPEGRLALSVWGAPDATHGPRSAAWSLSSEDTWRPTAGAPGVFSMGSEERTRELLDVAGFSSVRTEDVPVRFAFRDLDGYERWIIDVGGPFAMAVHGSPK